MRILTNRNLDKVAEIKQKLEENDGYCPCALIKDRDTKCMCKDFRNKINEGYLGECNCGLYKSVPSVVYICGDPAIARDNILKWSDIYTLKGAITLLPEIFYKRTKKDAPVLENVWKQKVQIADLIIVVDKFGKVDPTTEKIVEYTKRIKKNLIYTSDM